MTIQRSITFFLFYVQRWHRTDEALYIERSITIRYYELLHKIENIKMAGSILEMSSEMGDNHGNFELFRLDSSVRRKTRECAEVT